MTRHKNSEGFTLLEILLVVTIITILAAVIIIAINPKKQLAEARNSERHLDVTTILKAVQQYLIDNNGNLPVGIPLSGNCYAASNEICRIGASSCSDRINLDVLVLDPKYFISIPLDPSGASTNGAGYNIVKNSNNEVTVCAPYAERGKTIKASL